MIAVGNQPVEGRGRLDMHGNMLSLGPLHEIGKLPISPLNKDTLEWPAFGAQRFADSMQPIQQVRLVIASSGWCRRACLR
jgi:hypothetical protein